MILLITITIPYNPTHPADCLLSNNVYDYRIVSQGKTTIPSVDDASEFEDTDVRIGINKPKKKHKFEF